MAGGRGEELVHRPRCRYHLYGKFLGILCKKKSKCDNLEMSLSLPCSDTCDHSLVRETKMRSLELK